jgi:hypothetical protein
MTIKIAVFRQSLRPSRATAASANAIGAVAYFRRNALITAASRAAHRP